VTAGKRFSRNAGVASAEVTAVAVSNAGTVRLLVGKVMQRDEAWKQYEKAIQKSDTQSRQEKAKQIANW
jgi:hypothetical protein